MVVTMMKTLSHHWIKVLFWIFSGAPTELPPGSDIDVDKFEVTKELFDKVTALDKSMLVVDEIDVE